MNGTNQFHIKYYLFKSPILIKVTSILQKSAITIGLTFGSMIATIIGYLLFGYLVGLILHPSTHEHEYACACDEPPILTETETTIVGVIFMVGLMIGLFCILRQLKFSKWERFIALIMLLFANLYVASTIREILYIQVSANGTFSEKFLLYRENLKN